jgi:hypothetical protein
MLKHNLVSLLLVVVFNVVTANTIVLEGKYMNKNLFIQNSISDEGVGYCAYEIVINGHVTTDEVTSATIEVDFSALPIEPGAPVVVEIKHKNNCAPKVLNPEVLKPQPSFEMVDFKISENGLLNWTTINENESIPFIVEQYRWNKWVKVGQVNGKGKMKGTNSYFFQSVPHSGQNKFRVKQEGFGGMEKRSESATFQFNINPISHKTGSNKHQIVFSGETLFEIYDQFGSVMKYGYGKEVNIENLRNGKYFLCYDNTVSELTK